MLVVAACEPAPAGPRAPVASVTVAPDTVLVGETVPLVATLRDAAGNVLTGRLVTWASGDVAVARVTAAGLATGVAAGVATVLATSEGQAGTAEITVDHAVAVASVTVAPAAATIPVGGTVHLTATMRDGAGNVLEGRRVTWATSDPQVAWVSLKGLVTGVAPGAVTITATSEGRSGTAQVTVGTPGPVTP